MTERTTAVERAALWKKLERTLREHDRIVRNPKYNGTGQRKTIIKDLAEDVRALLSDVPAGGEPLVRVYRDGELLSQLRATPPGAGVAGVGYTVEVVPADTEGGEDRRPS